MKFLMKYVIAAVLSTILVFSGEMAEAKKRSGHKPKVAKAQVEKKKAIKKIARKNNGKNLKPAKRSAGYGKASEYMKRSPASKKKALKKSSTKKQAIKKKKVRKKRA